MDVRRIIREEIEKLVIEKEENSQKTKTKKDSGVRKNAIKTKNGRRKSFNYKEYNKENPNTNYSDNKQLAKLLKNPAVNLAAVARMVYPDHTPEGAQSQLRKEVEGEKAESGYEYKIRNNEVPKINKVLNKLGLR